MLRAKGFETTVDNAISNDPIINHLRIAEVRKAECVYYDFIHMRCTVNILNFIVQESLKETLYSKRVQKKWMS